MPNTFRPDPDAQPTGARYAIVISRYNATITERLLDGAVATLKQHGIGDEAIDVAWVPGAYEIPLAAEHLVASERYVAIVCLGAVIRGETTHDEHINRAVSLGLMELSQRSGIPVAFGVLTCQNMEQALNRAGGNVGNKGVEAASAALEMVSLIQQIVEPVAGPDTP